MKTSKILNAMHKYYDNNKIPLIIIFLFSFLTNSMKMIKQKANCYNRS